MNKIVKTLFTAAEESLDLQVLKQVTDFAKESNENIEMVYRQFRNFLKKDHAQIRFSCTMFADNMFNRSQTFRNLLLKDAQYFLDLTVINLPWPKDWAEKLKVLASESIEQWHLKYKSAHPQLVSLYALMKKHNEIEQTIIISRETHSDRISAFNANLFSKYIQEYADKKQNLYDSIHQCERLLEILIPAFQDDTTIGHKIKEKDVFLFFNLGFS
jgi:hypothetical protein